MPELSLTGPSARRRRLVAVAGALAAAFAVSTAPADAARTARPDAGRIVYGLGTSSDAPGTDGRPAIVDPEPGASAFVLDGPGQTFRPSPSWSPDRSRIVYSAGYDGPYWHPEAGRDLWVIQGDGSGATRLTSTPDVWESSPAWSPDGRTIAYTVDSNRGWALSTTGSSAIWLMEADGSGARRLSGSDAGDFMPAWSPDGRELAFARDGDIHAMTVATGETRQITHNGLDNHTPAWSPDGRRIAYSGLLTPSVDFASFRSREIFSIRADGRGQAVRLTDNDVLDVQPTWSPDGKRIAFERDQFMGSWWNPEIWTMRRNGSAEARVTTSGVDPDWK